MSSATHAILTDMRKAYGFTIVELLIVIVVIGVLAAISIVTYGNVSAKARDTQMRDGVAKFITALQMWSAEGGNARTGNWGSTVVVSSQGCADGSGGGFVAQGTYTCTTEDALVAAKALPNGFLRKLPKNSYFTASQAGMYTVMKYNCGQNSHAIYWTLERPTPEDIASFDDVASKCTGSGLRTSYGMQAAKLVQL